MDEKMYRYIRVLRSFRENDEHFQCDGGVVQKRNDDDIRTGGD